MKLLASVAASWATPGDTKALISQSRVVRLSASGTPVAAASAVAQSGPAKSAMLSERLMAALAQRLRNDARRDRLWAGRQAP